MENLIFTINDKKYLLMEAVIKTSNANQVKSRIKDCNGIVVGVKDRFRMWVFGRIRVTLKVLIPEENINSWSEDMLK